MAQYSVVIEELDQNGNVWDSHEVQDADTYEEAYNIGMNQNLSGPNEQVTIWEWDEDGEMVNDSWVIKTFEK